METDSGPTLRLDMVDGGDWARDHTLIDGGLAVVLTRARHVVDAPLNPIRVSMRQGAPRRLDAYREAFGDAVIDFGMDADATTFRPADMNLPPTTADADLADVLRPLAEALPPPPLLSTAWPERVAVPFFSRAVITEAIALSREWRTASPIKCSLT
ncbi:AraC family transcriptional regulator [Nocardia vinacea]|uniref:AraC family transcriptional regulator ligand-binding domain-containing protein n=1 Tax=Nocardia vinacea TaxID=96468 RepID=UPI002E11D927|nr:AraC family transcriptional regulator [Nocardia vinacea]